ncbi:MAG: hypothetical protein Ct9H90mP11_10110 [Acidimicrobiales bacterium]|nr:MAG: hypothetical protein Ct9H90mP11_10110 [Acidimicrobiales bacterium]
MLARNQSKLDKAIERIKSTNPSAVLKTGIADLSISNQSGIMLKDFWLLGKLLMCSSKCRSYGLPIWEDC